MTTIKILKNLRKTKALLTLRTSRSAQKEATNQTHSKIPIRTVDGN